MRRPAGRHCASGSLSKGCSAARSAATPARIPAMSPSRLEAFTDGVVAIVITIMVLDLRVPQGTDGAALLPAVPVFVAYVFSFINVGIFWSNHHHMLHATEHVDGRVLWANLSLLFWISLIP